MVCSLVKGVLLHPSWRSTAEHTPEWRGSSMMGTACCNSLVVLLLVLLLPLLPAVGHWPHSTAPGCSQTGMNSYPSLGFTTTSWVESNSGRVNDRE